MQVAQGKGKITVVTCEDPKCKRPNCPRVAVGGGNIKIRDDFSGQIRMRKPALLKKLL